MITMRAACLSIAVIMGTALTPPLASAQDMTSAESLARDYMAQYSAANWDGMEAFLAADVVFSDSTAIGPEYGTDGIHLEGRDAVMGMLREFGETYHPIELGFVWNTVFESNGRVVFMGEVNALYPTGTEGQAFRWHAPQVTVITVRDDRIIRQDDYANYTSPEEGIISH